MKNTLLIILFGGLSGSCAFLDGLSGTALEVVADPEVQHAAGSTVREAAAGNWTGALMEIGKLFGAVVVAWRMTEASRDRKRKKRGEPTQVATAST